MTQHNPTTFNAFTNKHSSYIAESPLGSFPENSSQYPVAVAPWNSNLPSHRSPASLASHLYPSSGGLNLSQAPKGYNQYISSVYSSPVPRSSNFHGSYDRHPHPSSSRRRSEQDIVYPTHAYTHSFSTQSISIAPHPSLHSERQPAQWHGSSRSPHSSSSGGVASLGWTPPTPENQYLSLNPHWDETISPPQSPEMRLYLPSAGYNFPHEAPTAQSSHTEASHDARRRMSPASSVSTASPPASRRGSVDQSSSGGKICSHCHATSTPLWRREPHTLKPLCNACGLYFQQRNKHRPQELIDADAADDLSESDGDASGPECSHCHTHHTSVWRRSKTGAQLCNACGVYSRLRGRDRPLSLKRNRIKPRTKHNIPRIE